MCVVIPKIEGVLDSGFARAVPCGHRHFLDELPAQTGTVEYQKIPAEARAILAGGDECCAKSF
jgi:hypothetical protein